MITNVVADKVTNSLLSINSLNTSEIYVDAAFICTNSMWALNLQQNKDAENNIGELSNLIICQ